jgi:tetratricopeptide (TPR) repeat protein
MRIGACIFILAVSLPPGSMLAADIQGPEPVRDAVLDGARAAGAQSGWAKAQSIVREGLARDPGNADYHNLYAYSVRKSAGPDMGVVFKHYNEALRLDPQHRGAHEYIGEAYLMVGNLAKAKEHLGVLDRLCFFPCAEYTDLKKAIAEFERKQVAR